MAALNTDQLQAINVALNEHLEADSLAGFLDSLEQIYFEYTRLLIKADAAHPDCEMYLYDFAGLINILKKGL